MISLAQLCLLLATAQCQANAQTEPQFFPRESQFVERETGRPLAAPTSRQLTDPSSGQSTFSGFNRQLTDPATGRSTFNGYSIKLTDPVTGRPAFKGYGENPLMQNRASAPNFKWSSNVDAEGRSQYSGFGRDRLTGEDGSSTFIGNNRRLTDVNGRPMFVGNNRQLSDPRAKEEFFNQYRPFSGRAGNGSSSGTSQPPASPVSAPVTREKDVTTSGAAQTNSEVTAGSRQAPPKSTGDLPQSDTGSGF